MVTRVVWVGEAAHPQITLEEKNAEHAPLHFQEQSVLVLLFLGLISCYVQFFNPQDLPHL